MIPLRAICADGLSLPVSLFRVPAGFPSPAEDYLENSLDIGERLIRHPKATFFMRAEGDSMIDAGINNGDLLVVDRAVQARDKSVVIARINDEFCVKRLRKVDGRFWLYPENPDYQPIEICEGDDVEIWGVVTHAITELQGKPAEKRGVTNGHRAR